MDEQLSPLLIALLIAVIGALTTWVERIRRDLAENTTISKEAKEASNGRLSEVLAKLDSERTTSAGLRSLLREKEDKLAYLLSQHPDLAESLTDFSDRRAYRHLELAHVADKPREDR